MKHIVSKQNRALLSELVRTDFKLRYQGSVLGYAWSLLRPLMIFLILYLVFVQVLGVGSDIPHFPVYLLLGIVLWNFFTEMTSQSLGAIVVRGELIRKIKIPRWIIVLSSSFSALINLMLNMVVVVVFMVISRVELTPHVFLLPLTLLQIYVFALGMSLFLSAAYVKYRDVNYIWEVLIQGGFYATPILYSMSLIPNVTIQKLMFMNPLAQTIQNARYELITQETTTIKTVFDGGWFALIPIGITILVLLGGIAYFRKESKFFAENI